MKNLGFVVLVGGLNLALIAAGCSSGGGGGGGGGSGGNGGSGGSGNRGGATGGASGGSAGGTSGDAGPPCGGCIELVSNFTDGNQRHGVIAVIGGTTGIDLHGATITARISVTEVGNAAFVQLFAIDTTFGSDYAGATSLPSGTAFSNVTYTIPAAPISNNDGGFSYDTGKIARVLFQVGSNAPPEGGTLTTMRTTILIDSITLTGAPDGGAGVGPYNFDTSITPFADSGIDTPATGTATWIP